MLSLASFDWQRRLLSELNVIAQISNYKGKVVLFDTSRQVHVKLTNAALWVQCSHWGDGWKDFRIMYTGSFRVY